MREKYDVVTEAIRQAYMGNNVTCTKEEYHSKVRKALQDGAGKCADFGEGMRASFYLEQVERLDGMYGPTPESEAAE